MRRSCRCRGQGSSSIGSTSGASWRAGRSRTVGASTTGSSRPSRTPPDHSPGAIHVLTFATTPLDLRQAALEGVAFRFAEIADLMPDVVEIVATGGALLEDGDWLQIMADALARPITVSGVKEASLRGAAALVLERLGQPPPAAPLGRVIEPRQDRIDVFRAARERQRRLYDAAT